MDIQKIWAAVCSFLQMLFLVPQTKKKKASWHDSKPFKYSFVFMGETVEVSADIPIRNYETFLRDRDNVTVCECGEKLSEKQVCFSVNGSGRTMRRPVKFCKKCDQNISDFSSLVWTKNGELCFI